MVRVDGSLTTIQNSRRTFLTAETLTWAKSLGRRSNNVAGPSVSLRRSGKCSYTDGEQKRVVDGTSSPVKKRTKSAKSGPRKKRRSAENDDDDEDEDDETDSEGSDAGASEVTHVEDEQVDEEEDEGEPIIGRGGRRSAKVSLGDGELFAR